MRFTVACLFLAPAATIVVLRNIPRMFGTQSDETCNATLMVTVGTIVGIYAFAGLWATL